MPADLKRIGRELAALEQFIAKRRKPEDRFAKYRNDPCSFCREVMRFRAGNGQLRPMQLWSRQEEILAAIAEHSRGSVRSGHKISKSTTIAVASLWWISTRPRGRVLLTSATDRQVKGILWRELRGWYQRSAVPLGGEIHLDPSTGLQFADGREIVGFTARDPERMAGYSGDEMLIFVDEASGIDEGIFEALEGNRAGGAHLWMFSNPTKQSGTFFDSHHSKRHLYKTIHVSSEETPNASGIGEPVPGLATADWIAEKRAEWGDDSPIYAVRVRGDFAAQAENAIVGLALVEESAARDVVASGPICIGVDAARFGDDESAIYSTQGKASLGLRTVQSMDGPDVAGAVLEELAELRAAMPEQAQRFAIVAVDEIGVGASVVDALRRAAKQHRIIVHAVNVAAVALHPDDYPRLRDELWFMGREWLKTGRVVDDSKLHGELVAPTYTYDLKGRASVESKDDVKKRLKRSPDRADAFNLSVYAQVLSKRAEASASGTGVKREADRLLGPAPSSRNITF